MKYNNLGSSGLKVSEISFGSWLTFGSSLDGAAVKRLMHLAVDKGINFFDNAEAYARGEAEVLMGQAVSEFPREDLVISTKIFWGGNGPNDTGLSWKHLVEGTRKCLRRLNLDYVDVLYCHRPDPSTPIEETVRAMDYIIKAGYAFYWGTSEWSALQIKEAFDTAQRCNCLAPITEQAQYNLFNRQRVEQEYLPLFREKKYGLTAWSPLSSGVLSGKYNDGIPKGSRLERNEWLQRELSPRRVAQVKELKKVAEEIGASLAQLAIAWCLRNANVSSVIVGATTVGQLEENLLAVGVRDRLDDKLNKRILEIVG